MTSSPIGRTARLRVLRGDDGTSLIELVVGMAILSIFLGMFTGAVIMMNQATNKSVAINLSSQQLNQGFLSLDKTVRYASAISTPGQCTGGTCTTTDWYVELLTTNAGGQLCTQLRVDTTMQQLQTRSWNPASPPLTPAQFAAVAFTAIASGVINGTPSTDRPFVQGATTRLQQLTFTFLSQSGPASTQANPSRSTFMIGALNSSIPPLSSPSCLQNGRT